MELLRSWILGMTASAILTGVINTLAPKGRWRGIMRLLCGFLLIFCMMRPFFQLDMRSISREIVSYKDSVGAFGALLEEESAAMMKQIIEREAAEYILDKAAQQGMRVTRVTLLAELDAEGCPYPCRARIEGDLTQQEKDRLTAQIEGELGIPKERLTWI